MSQGGTYPKDVEKTCCGCGGKKTFWCENRYQRRALYFCCDECAERYFHRTCKTEQAALLQIRMYYHRKGEGWKAGQNSKRPADNYHPDRKSDKVLKQEREEKERIKSGTFREQLRKLDAEYWSKVRQYYGLRGE